jgi:hypothetical protein
VDVQDRLRAELLRLLDRTSLLFHLWFEHLDQDVPVDVLELLIELRAQLEE